nr:MAG TPA: hypothetical protein [Caudoviricetes sp.]
MRCIIHPYRTKLHCTGLYSRPLLAILQIIISYDS